MKPIHRQYNHGGWHPFKKKEAPRTYSKMSDRETDIYGTEAQQLGDAVTQHIPTTSNKNETSTERILQMMSLNLAQDANGTSKYPNVDWSLPGEEPSEQSVVLPAFRASMDENTEHKDPINFFRLDPESQKYVRAKMDDADLSAMFGKELSYSEESFIRSEIFKDPGLLTYFMEIGEEPGKKEMKKIRTHSGRFRGQQGGNGTTTGGPGSRSLAIAQGNAGIWNSITNWFAWCKLDDSCK